MMNHGVCLKCPCSPPCQEPHDESRGVSQMPEVFPPL